MRPDHIESDGAASATAMCFQGPHFAPLGWAFFLGGAGGGAATADSRPESNILGKIRARQSLPAGLVVTGGLGLIDPAAELGALRDQAVGSKPPRRGCTQRDRHRACQQARRIAWEFSTRSATSRSRRTHCAYPDLRERWHSVGTVKGVACKRWSKNKRQLRTASLTGHARDARTTSGPGRRNGPRHEIRNCNDQERAMHSTRLFLPRASRG